MRCQTALNGCRNVSGGAGWTGKQGIIEAPYRGALWALTYHLSNLCQCHFIGFSFTYLNWFPWIVYVI